MQACWQLGLWMFLAVFYVGGAQGSESSTSLSPQVVTPSLLKNVQKKYGAQAANRVRAWQALMAQLQGRPEKVKLIRVNEFFNTLPFVSDERHWHKQDYWATPLEFLGSNGGDCEDFVIAKYFTLRALGVPEQKMYLTYVKAVRLNQAHMVLTYFKTPSSVPLVLDNLRDRILPAVKRQDLIPVYSFNGSGLWLARLRGKGKLVHGGVRQLTQWKDLLQRMNG